MNDPRCKPTEIYIAQIVGRREGCPGGDFRGAAERHRGSAWGSILTGSKFQVPGSRFGEFGFEVRKEFEVGKEFEVRKVFGFRRLGSAKSVFVSFVSAEGLRGYGRRRPGIRLPQRAREA
jgi:hypothetical protein